jgi:L-lactate dehydrogenase complex protein LldF
MKTCQVYRRSGLSYGATYSGPIGLIIDRPSTSEKYSDRPYASSLNSSLQQCLPGEDQHSRADLWGNNASGVTP